MKRISLEKWKRLLSRRALTLTAVGVLLLGAVVTNVVMNRQPKQAAAAGEDKVTSVSSLGTGTSFFEAYREERDSVRTEELALSLIHI